MTVKLPTFQKTPAICAYRQCSRRFAKTTPGQKFCARACLEAESRAKWRAAHPPSHRREMTIVCAHCGLVFTRKSFEGQVARYCSQRCAQADRFQRVSGELAEIKGCGQMCASCGLDTRLLGELKCWLRVCPNRNEKIEDAKLDELASQLAIAGLDMGERTEALVSHGCYRVAPKGRRA